MIIMPHDVWTSVVCVFQDSRTVFRKGFLNVYTSNGILI